MSSPSRQIANRRLPPLPNGARYSPVRRKMSPNHSSGYPSINSASGTASSTSPPHGSSTRSSNYNHNTNHKDFSANLSDGPFRPALMTSKPLADRKNGSVPQEIDAEDVKNYLQQNPLFLEDYVMKNVDQERLERWLIRKTQKLKDKQKNRQVSAESKQIDHRPSLSKWKFCVHSDKKKMLQELTHDIHQSPNKQKVLMELANCIASACHADHFTLYILDTNGNDLYIHNPNLPEGKTSAPIKMQEGTTIAAYVALTHTPVRTNEILGDERFPQGTGVDEKLQKLQIRVARVIAKSRFGTSTEYVLEWWKLSIERAKKGSTAQSVLCQPIVQSNGDLVGVIELSRMVGHDPFAEEDEEIVNSYLVWGGISLYYAEMFRSMQQHRKLSEFLLNVTRSIFQDIISMDTVIMKIMNYAQTLVSADRTSLFLVDSKTNELYARIFDIGGSLEDSKSSKLQKEIRFPRSKGVAGYVATTGETLNITDAYHDDRFNREIDLQTGYTTRTLLCMPIFIRGNIIGVVQMVNKKTGVFTAADEKSFQTFAIYCGLALHHAKLYDKIRRSEQKHRVALEVLSYHSMCSDDELERLKDISNQLSTPYSEIETYEFNSYNLEFDVMPALVIQMTENLFTLAKFDIDELRRFVLTVRKNYRRVPYHNWTHAFAVAHCMYTVIRSNEGVFDTLEGMALFFSCLCHDLDHRGRTNSWMKAEGTPLAAVYTTSTMEHHHFNQTITILQHEGHNIFSHLSSGEYKTVLGYMKDCILATDLALFFGNKARLKGLIEDSEFAWDNAEHRKLVRAISMTGCDVSACTKPWQIQYATVKVIFQEFYSEGDLLKTQGRQPIPMMDRDTANELPAHQVGFIVGICLPCYDLMQKTMPGSEPLLEGAQANLTCWSDKAEKQKQEKEKREKEQEERENKEKENYEQSSTGNANEIVAMKDKETGKEEESGTETDK